MRRGHHKIKLLIGVGIVLFALVKYCASVETNPYTGKEQHITISEDE